MSDTFDPVDLVSAHEKATNGTSDFGRASRDLVLVVDSVSPGIVVEALLENDPANSLPSWLIIDVEDSLERIDNLYLKAQHNGRTYLFRK